MTKTNKNKEKIMKTRAKLLCVLLAVLTLALVCGVTVSAIGASVSVSVTAYNTGSEVTVSLLQGEEVKYTNFITLPEGGNKTTRTVEVPNVTIGTYDIVIESEGCIVSRVNGVTVDRAINLALYDNPELNNFELIGGDINSDGFIDSTDVSGLVFDMTKPESEATYDFSDINGDGSRDAIDVSIIAFNLFKEAPEIEFVSELPTYTALGAGYSEKVETNKGTEVTVTVSADRIDVISADGSAITLDVAADRIDSGLTFSSWNPTVTGYSGSLEDKNGLILEIAPITADNGVSFNMLTHLSWDKEANVLRKNIEYMTNGTGVHVTQIVLDTIDITGENKLLNVFGDMINGTNTFQYNSHPAYLTNHFMGIEFPVATTNDSDDGTKLYIQHVPEVDMTEGFWYTSKTEICGLADGKDSEEAFWDYMYPKLRVNNSNPKEFFFNYDTWWSQYDIQFTEARILELMEEFFGGISKYGASVKCFTLDLGWSEVNSIWQISHERFPEEFKNIVAYANENGNGSPIGFWFSPASSYPMGISLDWAESEGYKIADGYAGICFWDDNYKNELKKNIYYNVHEYGVGVLRADGLYLTCTQPDHGHGGDGSLQATRGTDTVEHSAENYIEVLKAAIEANPDIFINSINTFSPSNPSPWWMEYVDATNANMGNDIPKGRVPAPDYRASYTTARDFYAMQGLCNFDIPAEAQEVFGLVHQRATDFTNDFVSVLFRGNFFIDMYVNDDYMSEERYERLATMMNWAEANADSLLGGVEAIYHDSWTLYDTYPIESAIQVWREPYGYAHDGLVMLRNPWVIEAEKTIDAPIPEGDNGTYDIISLYPEVRVYAKNVRAGEKITVKLSGYETVVLAPETPGKIAQEVYTPAKTITVTNADFDYTSTGSSLSGEYSATVNVTDETNQLLVLFEAVSDPKKPTITIKVDGIAQEIEYRGTGIESADMFYADGAVNPESWLYAIVDIPAGEHTIDISFVEEHVLLKASAYIWSTRGTATAATHDNMLPHPEVISGDSCELYSVDLLEGNKFVFANCDDVTQTANLALTLETENVKEGTGAIKAENHEIAVSYPIIFGRAFDLTDFEKDGLVHLWVYVSDSTKLTNGLSRVEISHDSGAAEKNFTYWNIRDLVTGWNELILPVSEADQNNADFTRINYLRFYHYVNGDMTIIVDDVYMGLREHIPGLHTATFEGGTATGGSAPEVKNVTVGSTLPMPENSFTNYGYTFTGWLCNTDNAVYQPGEIYTVTDADAIFTAQWEEGIPENFEHNLAMCDTASAGAVSDTHFFMNGQGGGTPETPTAQEIGGKIGFVTTAREGINVIQRHPINTGIWQLPLENLALSFDFYVEDASVFTASSSYFNIISGVNTGLVQTYFSSFGTIESGWNSLYIPLKDMNKITGTLDLLDIQAISVGVNVTANTNVGMANVKLVSYEGGAQPPVQNSTVIALDSSMTASDTAFIIGPDVVYPTAADIGGKTAFGASAPASAGYFIIQKVADMSISGKTADKYVYTIDLYIEDITKIDLATSSTRIIIGPSQVDANGGAWVMPLASANLANGWNKIELPLVSTYFDGALDVSEITVLPFSAINTHINLTGDTVVAAADARLVEAGAPEQPEVPAGVIMALDTSANGSDTIFYTDGATPIWPSLSTYGERNAFGAASGGANTYVIQKYPLAPNCTLEGHTATEYTVKLDLYISDISLIDFTQGGHMKAIIGPSEVDAAGGAWTLPLTAENLTTGWNRIELPLTSVYYGGSLDVSTITTLPFSAFNLTLFTSGDVTIAAANARLLVNTAK